MKYYKKLIGERIYLAPISPDEVDPYLKWMNDEEVAVNFGQFHRVVASKSDLGWIYESSSDMQRYAIVLLEEDQLIGNISLHNIDHLNRNAYIGIFLGEAERRGRGYGAEAIKLVLRYGFQTMNLHHIMLTVHGDNSGAISCYQKVGFHEVGRLREWVFKDGRYVDKLYMGIMKQEFQG